MSNVYDISASERRREEASLWIARLDAGLSPEQAEQLGHWMGEDPDNESALLEMASLWDRMDALGRLSSLFPAPRRTSHSLPAYAIAAAVSLVAVALVLWFAAAAHQPLPQPAPKELVYEARLGEQSRVTLADGTGLVLNTNSRITVEYTDAYRLITLERGEIFVDVARDSDRPLSVVAADQVVQAVGTQFNVKITSDQKIELMVVEGRVRVGVHQRPRDAAASPPPVLSGSAPSLAAGESMVLGAPEVEVAAVSPADIQVKLSWRQGNLVFRGESLEQAVQEVARYTPVEFVFLDQDLKKIRVAGLFRAGDVDGLLATLRENFDIVYQYEDESRVLLGKE